MRTWQWIAIATAGVVVAALLVYLLAKWYRSRREGAHPAAVRADEIFRLLKYAVWTASESETRRLACSVNVYGPGVDDFANKILAKTVKWHFKLADLGKITLADGDEREDPERGLARKNSLPAAMALAEADVMVRRIISSTKRGFTPPKSLLQTWDGVQ